MYTVRTKRLPLGAPTAYAWHMPTSIAPTSVRWPLAALSLSMLLSSLGTSIANVGLPAMEQAFAASFHQVQWIVLAYLLAITLLIVVVGRLGDVFGRKRLLLMGIALYTLASGLCSMAPTLWLLVAARAVQGVGAATMMALSMAFVREAVPKEKTGSAMGLLGTMSAIGTALGPSLGGVLIATLDWRAIFYVSVPLGLLAYGLAWRYLPVDRTEVRASPPLLRLALLREPAFAASLGMNALVATVMASTFVVGPFYLARGLSLDAAQVGMVMSVGPVISILFGVVAGRLVDRLGAERMVPLGLLALLLGCAVLAGLGQYFGIAGYVAGIAILTPGYQLFQAANNTAVMVDVQPDQRGVVSAMLSLSRNLGLMAGVSAMGAVFAWGAAANVTHGMQLSFGVAAGLMVVALVLGALANHSAMKAIHP